MKYIKKPSNQFLKEYKLPLGATFAFAIILLALLFSRTVNRIVLADVLGRNSNNDYSKLLSSDQKDDFRKNESADESTKPESATAAPPTKPSFTVYPNPSPDAGPTPSDPGQPTPPPSSEPFTASIVGFGLHKTEYEYCNTGSSGMGTSFRCYKKYFFKGRINSLNGPGSVKYDWEGNFDVINSSGSFSVSSAEAYTDVLNEFKLACSDGPAEIQIKLIVTEPNFSETPVQEHAHDCSTP